MGKNNDKPNPAQQVIDRSAQAYQDTAATPSPLEQEMTGRAQGMFNSYNDATQRNMADYGNIMSGYQNFSQNLKIPHVSAQRPGELGESYGYLREAMPGYRDFAATGGYSDKDIQELRARGVSPIRSAYGNTMRELDRARALGGDASAVNYTAALSRAQRDLPEQMANAMTNVNAGLADSIRQGKQFGLAGITGTGSTMGGLSSQEANRMLQADMANQGAEMQGNQMRLQSLGGQSSLYGTTPGLSSMFGNQALNAYGQAAGMQNQRNAYGLGLLNAQLQGYNTEQQNKGTPWWQQVLGAAGTVAPFFSSLGGGGNSGTDLSVTPYGPGY